MRLIDTDALIPGKLLAVNLKNPMETVEYLMNRINNAPTIDAVPVVRCKDCKHSEWDSKPHDAIVCTRTNDGYWRKSDDFCSYGERRSDD